jgi:hypothetical protein
MGKQTLGRAKKVLSILLLVLFAISVTAATVSADYYSRDKCSNGYWECKYPYYGYNNDQYGKYCQGHWLCPGSYNGGGYGGGGY